MPELLVSMIWTVTGGVPAAQTPCMPMSWLATLANSKLDHASEYHAVASCTGLPARDTSSNPSCVSQHNEARTDDNRPAMKVCTDLSCISKIGFHPT